MVCAGRGWEKRNTDRKYTGQITGNIVSALEEAREIIRDLVTMIRSGCGNIYKIAGAV